MSDPTRWSRAPGVPRALSRALAAGRAIEPPKGAERRVLDGVLGVVGVVAATGAASSTIASASATATDVASVAGASAGAGPVAASAGFAGTTGANLAGVKLALLLLGSAGAVIGGVAAVQHLPARHRNAGVAVSGQASPGSVMHVPDAPASPRPGVAPSSQPVAQHPAAAQPRTGAVSAVLRAPSQSRHPAFQPNAATGPDRASASEAQQVLDARRQLQRGDVRAALASLDAADRRFARGLLQQERELLRIRAYERAGQRDRVRQLMAAFVARHPDSPYAPGLRVSTRLEADEVEPP